MTHSHRLEGGFLALGWLVVVATLSDVATFLVMIDRHGMKAEMNPIVVELASIGLVVLLVAKAIAVGLLLTAVALSGRRRLGLGLLLTAVLVGAVGTASNLWAMS